MLLPVAHYPDSFSLTHIEEQHLLIGRWLCPVQLVQLQAHYELVLEAAQAHGNCRRWLLDVRRRDLHDAGAAQWFGEEFSPRLLGALGQPVAVAYFAMVGQDIAATDPNLRKNIREGAQHGISYQYFNQESEAMAWLARHP